MTNTMKHEVIIFKLTGKTAKPTWNCQFITADDAYECYIKMIDYLKHHLIAGEHFYVARFNDNQLMTMEEVK